MNIKFNNGNDKDNKASLTEGGYREMVTSRKKNLPEIEATIQDILKDYAGENICIIIQREDENGLPDHSHVFMGGVSRLETQVAMAKTLDQTSHKAIELLMESSKGDVKAMLAVVQAVMEMSDKKSRKR